MFLKSEYSYLQYHWWPIDLMVINGWLISSLKYKIFNEGIARKIKIIIGRIVQIISIVWLWRIILLFILFIIKFNKIYKIIIVIIIIIIMAWSWKNIKFSIIGELASCKLIIDQLEISKKKLFYVWSLNSLHYSAIIELNWK